MTGPSTSKWTKRLWIAAGLGLLAAIAPVLIALLGHLIDNATMQHYPWLLYFSVPAGVPIALAAGIAAIVVSLRTRSN